MKVAFSGMQYVLRYYVAEKQVENWQTQHYADEYELKKAAARIAKDPRNSKIQARKRYFEYGEWQEVDFANESG